MASNSKWSKKRLNPAVHQLYLIKHYVNGQSRLSCGMLQWIGHLKPTPLSANYKVKVRYRPGNTPVVQVLDPKLKCDEEGRLPHVYPGDELCLYYPGEWNGSEQIGDTIVPWISEWLYHYECWAATGTWLGGGEHPKVKRNKKRSA